MPAQGDKFGEMGGDEFKIDEKCILAKSLKNGDTRL